MINMSRVGTRQPFFFENLIQWCMIDFQLTPHLKYNTIQYLGLCDSGWDGDRFFLGFYLILMSVLEHIRYLVTSSTDIRNIYTVIYSFGDIVENCST